MRVETTEDMINWELFFLMGAPVVLVFFSVYVSLKILKSTAPVKVRVE